jgi:hypothetical protein
MRKIIVAILCLLTTPLMAQQRFAEIVGNVPVQPVKQGPVVEVPFMTWGGDVPFFIAAGAPGNPSLTTQRGSAYEKLGVNVKFYKENDFANQVKDYMGGRTPFLRGTFSSLGMASEVLGSDPRTKPVVFLFVSWSAGDHMVSRQEIRTLNDLKRPNKKVRIAVQQGGAHVQWLYDILHTAQVERNEIEIVWAKELAGPGSAADLFKKDNTIDAAFAITPDMVGLTSGVDKAGTGAEGTVKGAHVLVSTQQMTHAIPDIVAVRSDFFKANRPFVEKFAAGYLNATEQLVGLRKTFEESKKMPPQYAAVLNFTQQTFGKDTIPDPTVDGHGLMLDCVFGGLPGNIAFFTDRQTGFDAQTKTALDMAQAWGYVQQRRGFDPGGLDWRAVATAANVKYVVPDLSRQKINAEATKIGPDTELDDRTIYSFTINFDPNEEAFSADRYGADFERALTAASKFGGAVVVIRGHSDPTQTLLSLLKAGQAKGLIKREGGPGNYKYYLNGKPLDLTQTAAVVNLIKQGSFDGTDPNPKETMQAALDLSLKRARAVQNAVVGMAKQQNIPVDTSQIQPVGAGIAEPLIAKPANIEEAKKNMRVEFQIVKVNAEAIKAEDFSY